MVCQPLQATICTNHVVLRKFWPNSLANCGLVSGSILKSGEFSCQETDVDVHAAMLWPSEHMA